MTSTTPLQILLFRNESDLEIQPYEAAIVRAFQGGKEAGGYLATGEDLGIQLEVFATAPAFVDPATKLDSVCHTLTVVLLGPALLEKGDDLLWDWLVRCWQHTDRSGDRHRLLVVAMNESLGDQFIAKSAELQSLQLLQASHLDRERATRPSSLALRMLHECRLLLAEALPATSGHPAGHLRLFISHAKIDGLPLAHALKHHIQTLGFQTFYDVDDLPAGGNWKKQLERGVESSLIVMLRTDVYDSRPWCQQEVYWADEYAVPAVLVDARTRLAYAAGDLPLDRIPTVRIPDGNLMRILNLALREGLRYLLFKRKVMQMQACGEIPVSTELRVFCHRPSMPALLRACRSLAGATSHVPRIILYPDPVFREGQYEAALALVAAHATGALLTTPNTLTATRGAGL